MILLFCSNCVEMVFCGGFFFANVLFFSF